MCVCSISPKSALFTIDTKKPSPRHFPIASCVHNTMIGRYVTAVMSETVPNVSSVMKRLSLRPSFACIYNIRVRRPARAVAWLGCRVISFFFAAEVKVIER